MKTFIFHSKPIKKRRYTVAGVLSQDGKTLSIGSAVFCSTKKDTFTKKRGREIAVGRAIKNPIVKDIPVEDPKHVIKFFNSKAEELSLQHQIEFYTKNNEEYNYKFID